jgi:hypothetical protein
MPGTRRRVMRVEKRPPKPRATDMGTRKRAWTSVSLMMGIRPTKVVTLVAMMERKRLTPAFHAASLRGQPWRRKRLMRSVRTRLSLTTMPERAMTPHMDMMLRFKPSTMWPMMAPTTPKGITDMTMSGWE